MTLAASMDKRVLLARLLLEKHRKHFPTLAHKDYFNFGAQGLISTPAVTAIGDYFTRLQADAPFTVDNALNLRSTMNRSRELLAAELGARPTQISLTANTSEGCNLAMWGLDWQPGDHILLSNHEYPGVVATARSLAQHFGLKLSFFPVITHGRDPLHNLPEHMNAKTRLVVLSHVLWDTGTVIPLDEAADICHEHEALLLVDGAQSFGAMPLQMEAWDVDFFAFTAHKWLCGPEGVGGLYIGDQAASQTQPMARGWRGLALDQNNCPTGTWPDARRFEIGTPPSALFAGLNATVELHNGWGNAARRFERVQALATQLWQGLKTVAPDGIHNQESGPSAGLVFLHCERAVDMVTALEIENIMVRTIPGENVIRMSTHYLNREQDIDRLIESVGSIWKKH